MLAPLAVAVVGCGSGEPATPTAEVTTTAAAAKKGPDLSTETFTDLSAKDKVEVDARDNDFIEPYITVKAGTTITFANKGRNQHDIVPVADGAFAKVDPGDFDPGSTTTITFTKDGDYPYYCSLHGTPTKGMVGAIRVIG